MKKRDVKSGKDFYVHKEARKTQWKVPASWQDDAQPAGTTPTTPSVSAAVPNKLKTSALAVRVTKSNNRRGEWLRRKDPKTNRYFYAHAVSKTTTWKTPDVWREPTPVPSAPVAGPTGSAGSAGSANVSVQEATSGSVSVSVQNAPSASASLLTVTPLAGKDKAAGLPTTEQVVLVDAQSKEHILLEEKRDMQNPLQLLMAGSVSSPFSLQWIRHVLSRARFVHWSHVFSDVTGYVFASVGVSRQER